MEPLLYACQVSALQMILLSYNIIAHLTPLPLVSCSDFSPGDASCENKPLLTLDYDMIAPGIHYQSPWAPMAWRVGDIEYILRRDIDFDVWIEPKRRNAAKLAKNYIRFNAEMQQRAECAHPKRDNSLGIHIRHSDKGVTRGGGKLSVLIYHRIKPNLKVSPHIQLL